jgi:hypothetical protein
MTSTKYAIDMKYRSDHHESSSSNLPYGSDQAALLPFIPDADEAVHSYDGFEYRARFRVSDLPSMQSRAIHAASAIGNPIFSTGAALRYSGKAPGLRTVGEMGKGYASFRLNGLLVPTIFTLVFFIMLYAADRFSTRSRGALRLLIAIFILWFIYALTLGTVTLFTASGFVNSIIVRFGVELNPLPIMLLDAPFRIAALGALYMVISYAIKKGKADKLKNVDVDTEDKESAITGLV